MPGIMQRLRSQTRDRHVQLEHTVDLRSRFESREGYRDLLRRMLGLHGPLEQALLRLDWSGTAIDLGERRKTAWLHQDLLALNFSEREIEAIPVCVEIPELTSVARGIGCLYVLEGSTLGGAVIARQLERVLEIGTDQGARFYASYGERLNLMWASFGAAADAICDSAVAADQACAAAHDTFACFEAWFRRDPGDRLPEERNT
jgi:heme oxygenase